MRVNQEKKKKKKKTTDQVNWPLGDSFIPSMKSQNGIFWMVQWWVLGHSKVASAKQSWHSNCSSIVSTTKPKSWLPKVGVWLDPQSSPWGHDEDMMRTTPSFSYKLDTSQENETTTRQDETSTVKLKKLSDQLLWCQLSNSSNPRL
jgi:hypothetical protein